MKVKIEDFQILKGTTTFEFPVGITVIVGPNASGKSSTFYAIQNALLNPSGVSNCINNDSTKAKVTIENNGNSVTWVRTPSSSEYINNNTGEKFIKASKLTSQDIADLGFYFDNKGKVVNIHDEWSVLFPYGESDTDMFRLFEDIFNISCSFQIIDEIKKDEQLIKSDLATYGNVLNTLISKQTVLNDIKNSVKLDDINNHIEVIKASLLKVDSLKADKDIYDNNYMMTKVAVPNKYDETVLDSASVILNDLLADYNNYSRLKPLSTISVPPINLNIEIEDNIELINDYNSYLQTLQAIDINNTELNKINERINILNTELSKIAVCPTCGRPLEE